MKFYYNNAGSPAGPYEKEELAAYNISPDTLVWHEGLADWKPANEIAELADWFAPAPEPEPIQEPEPFQELPPAAPEPPAYGTPVPPAPLGGTVPPPATSGMATPSCPPPTVGTPAPQPYTAAPAPGSPTGAVPPPSPYARPAAPYTPSTPQTPPMPPMPPAGNGYYPGNAPAECAAPVDFKSGKGVAVATIVIASMAMVFGLFSYCIAWIFAVPSLVLAILAISKSSNAVRVAAAGNREAAENMARSVRTMGTISIILGALGIITVLLLLTVLSVLIYDAVNSSSSYYDPYDYDYDYYESLRMMLGSILRF